MSKLTFHFAGGDRNLLQADADLDEIQLTEMLASGRPIPVTRGSQRMLVQSSNVTFVTVDK